MPVNSLIKTSSYLPIFMGDGVLAKYTDHVGDGVLVKYTDHVGDGVLDVPLK